MHESARQGLKADKQEMFGKVCIVNAKQEMFDKVCIVRAKQEMFDKVCIVKAKQTRTVFPKRR